MYEFIYKPFDFLDKFNDNIITKIFVIESDIGFEFYHVENGVIFSASITKKEITRHMNEIYNTSLEEESISQFKEVYLTNITTPIAVIKDNERIDVKISSNK